MQITIRPDPDCIELIRSEFKDMVIRFLKSVGISKRDAENWEAGHTVEINENAPPLVDVFDMKCYLPDELFSKPEWIFKFSKEELFNSFVISGIAVCCGLLSTDGLKSLPQNLLNLNCSNYQVETLNKNFQELKNLPSLKSISFKSCTKLENISLLENLVNLQTLNFHCCNLLEDISSISGLLNLQTLNLGGCESLTDISNLSGLLNLKTLDLSGCESLTDISSLSGLINLQWLDLSFCESLTDISSLAGLLNLQSLNLSYCKSLTDISRLAGLLNLQSLDLSNYESLTDINSLSGLVNLQKLDLSGKSLTDIRGLAGLFNLQTLSLSDCKSLTDISSLSGLVNLQRLILHGFGFDSVTDISCVSGLVNLDRLYLTGFDSLTDISSLSGLLNLQSLVLCGCESLMDISSLSGLLNLKSLYLHDCESLMDISSLSSLVNLQSLDLVDCKRIQNYSSLRSCLALKDLKENHMHPAEFAELLCFLAVQRKDISFIIEKFNSWFQELKLGFRQKDSSTNDLACSLAQGIVLANLVEAGSSFHQTLLNHPDVGIAPWKIWFSENLKTFGWDKIQKLAELSKPSELTFGPIGGISSCLPSLEGDTVQIAWAKKWISEIHSLHNNNPNFLKPAVAEWCLALKRLGEDELLREWIEKFTDPSDPSALDPINKVFSAYALDLNDSESALEYSLKINDPKPRDESILNLALQFIKAGETTKAGEFLFLLTQIESRTQLAYSLAEDAAYLKSDENAHRLLVACGDNSQSLANILDKLRIANPASEILKIMHEKLSDESRLHIPASLIMQESNSFTNTLLKIKDPGQLERIQQVIDSVMKSS